MSVTDKIVRSFYLLAHDFVGHPLIGISSGARWAYRLHDRITDFCEPSIAGYDRDVGHFEGPEDMARHIEEAIDEKRYEVIRHKDGSNYRINMFRKSDQDGNRV